MPDLFYNPVRKIDLEGVRRAPSAEETTMVDRTGSRSVVEPGWRASGWGLAAALALLALALALALFHPGTPAPKPASAPAAEFAAGRAHAVLRDLLGDGSPHPLGTPANDRVRERILAQLRTLGLSPEVQEAVACSGGRSCGRVKNVLARLPGREPGKSVLLMAHYDSVGAGPGAGDDMSGVATILEVARILKAGPPLRHGVLLLLDEGEEAGLLGAQAFADHSPAMAEVGAVVNLEARGTAGPSLMFETSGPDAWMVSRYAAGAASPVTSSLFVTIYQFMPNNTDLTVFKQRNVPGLNFAFIDHPALYHSAEDDLDDLSLASLQHHGDNALAAVRGLAEADLASPPPGRAVFFDLLHAVVIRWPAGLSPLLGLLALILTLAAAFLARRRGLPVWGGSFVLGFTAALTALLLVAGLAFVLRMLVAPGFPTPWVARPHAATGAFWLIAFGGALGLAGLMGRRASLPGLWTGVWVFWSLLGLVLGVLLPGTSYLFIAPALVAGLCGLLLGGSAGGRTTAAILPVFFAGLLWFPILRSLYLGLGLFGLLVTAVLLSLVFSALIPLMAGAGVLQRRWLPLAAVVLAVVFAFVARTSPPYSPDSPQQVDVMAWQDAGAPQSRWVVFSGGPFPAAMRQAAGFGARPEPPFPWSSQYARAYVAPAPALNLPAPELTVLADTVTGGKRTVRLRLTSPRGAPVVGLRIPAAAQPESVRMDGEPVPVQGDPRKGPPRAESSWRLYTLQTVAPQGSEVEVVLGAAQPMDWYVVDQSYDVPPTAQPLLAARPKDAVAVQDGNGTVVSRKVRI
jgi:hypothetical protein